MTSTRLIRKLRREVEKHTLAASVVREEQALLGRRLGEVTAELNEIHSLLDGIPGAPGRTTLDVNAYNRRPLTVMQRLAGLSIRGRRCASQ